MMKCLSIQQPWACVIVRGWKTIENRTWRSAPSYRGPVLIHAGKTLDSSGLTDIIGIDFPVHSLVHAIDGLAPERTLGAIIGGAILTAVLPVRARCTSKWYMGELGFVFEMPVVFKEPIPLRGQLGIFEVAEPSESYLCGMRDWYRDAQTRLEEARAITARRHRNAAGWDAV